MYLAVREDCDTVRVQDEQVKTDSYITLSQSVPDHQDPPPADLDLSSVQEISTLKVQLREAEETAQRVQREVGLSL